ncbi:cobalamin biosynthesis protein CobG [Streptomyces sp. JH14]|uniref:cobalamin biosynthesis protein CobG n=1 Tax=Streptomyces sp. JH14 TaxID=2793630 RepID=UPI0023F889DE|nr:cobalamin biosynthesis protein CobG [Streptomyces sp. JH14]MDF6043397.1 cobalamin biosynthesis protein CobG [Streptomyces sp. JH14]
MLAAMSTSDTPPSASGEPFSRDRGDACPGSLRLHRADDGALARVRIPGGVLNMRQADVLRQAARELSDGELHLTSRGNVQLRGLDADCGGRLAELLGTAGLLPSWSHERIRNVVASPLSGLDGRGRTDVRPWLTGLDGLLCGSDKAAGLSGRFLFALDDGRGDVDALGADVTLLGRGDGTALLRIGAAEAVLRVSGADAPRAALVAAETFVDAARETGAWRVSELPLPAEELLSQVGTALRAAGVDAADRLEHVPPPTTAQEPAYGRVGTSEPVALCVGVPFGRLTGAQWEGLTRAGGEVRLTPWRSVVVTGVARGGAAARLAEWGAAGLVVGPGSAWTGVGACIGRPGCAKSLADVRGDAEAAVTAGDPGIARLPVYWSGCERRCGHPKGSWVDVVAVPGGHQVSLVRGDVRGAPATVLGSPSELAAAVTAARSTSS